MSIALEMGNGIRGSGFIRGIGCIPIYEASEIAGIQQEGPRLNPPPPASGPVAGSEPSSSFNSSSSSSIGKNSDCAGSDGEDSSEEREVQSAYQGPLDGLRSLEDSLPIRRGISNFYCGKSKSFTSLADAVASSTPSSKDLAKPENAYSRKNKNLVAFKTMWVKPHGISKKPAACSSRSTLAFAVAMRSNNGGEEGQDKLRLLPPLHPLGKTTTFCASPVAPCSSRRSSFSLRSFSLTDLQGIAGSSTGPRDKHKMFY